MVIEGKEYKMGYGSFSLSRPLPFGGGFGSDIDSSRTLPKEIVSIRTKSLSHFSFGSFHLNGSVEDDVFTGYLTYTWTAGDSSLIGLSIDPGDQLTTTATMLFEQASSFGPNTSPVIADATLTADDGMFEVSETIQLTCLVPGMRKGSN